MPGMKKGIGLGAVAILALTLAACSSQEPTPTPAPQIAQKAADVAPSAPSTAQATDSKPQSAPSAPTDDTSKAPEKGTGSSTPAKTAAPAPSLEALAEPGPDDPVKRPVMPEIELPLKKNQPAAKLSSYKGKVVLVDFWATWCGPCRMAIPELEALYKKYHSKGLEVIGISVDDANTRDVVPVAQEKLGMTYPVVFYEDMKTKPELAVQGLPHVFLVDKKGRVGGEMEGYDPSSNLEQKIVQLLK